MNSSNVKGHLQKKLNGNLECLQMCLITFQNTPPPPPLYKLFEGKY